MLQLVSRSIAAKMAFAFALVFIVLSISYVVMDRRLNTIQSSMDGVTNISNHAISILRINKDIVEMQRDISVYGSSGSSAVFAKIEDNFQSIQQRLKKIEKNDYGPNEQLYIDSLSELVLRYGDNLNVLVKRYDQKTLLMSVELPRIYFNAIADLKKLEAQATNTNAKLVILNRINTWHALHNDAQLFLTKKDYSKRQSVMRSLKQLSTFKISSMSALSTQLESNKQLAKSYQKTFNKSVQANRNYLSLVNVVMAGDAIEFSTLADALREQLLQRLSQIKELGETTIVRSERVLQLLGIGIIFYVIILTMFFHFHIAHAIKRLTKSFQCFLNGDLSEPINDLSRHDELGVLAQAANRFRVLSKDLESAKQAAEHTSKVKSEFLANMSHEIRTPMNGILGMARQLSNTTLTDKQARMLEIIQSSGSSLLVIINDILDLSKIDAEKIVLESKPINLNKLLDEMRHLFSDQVMTKNVSLFVSSNTEEENTIFLGDETRLKQVLINLTGNAVKFTERGSVALNVSVQLGNEGRVKLLFDVSDTGIGIDKENIDTLFEAFSQADTSITRRFGGTGLGLAITSKLLGIMQAPLQVESELGKGSRFYFELNTYLGEELAAPVNTFKDKSLEQEIDFSHLHVLVVEDNKINQIVIEALLNELTITAITLAGDGKQAIEQCELYDYDLILMDMQMPVLDGPQATKEIRKIPNYYDTPIIALTANVLAKDKQQCFDAGMNDFLAKPIDYECLKAMLLRWCARFNNKT
ncbi:hybrid sensor histidine kinase/response regulator [Pseudoalteromonas sp. KS88]|uniref:hybrid sensor histidine kinase/response regulator n=1 Tax=Pseudoalteromonas sp. KS88 TaxID=2109918 RepID=UPI001081C95B|nr:response regulator [Pseudoalteromonas sp. KS88]TGE84116.1 hybrid sensor histidine kinase/response regulator [Pseudoalteromonas sp. KS88]